MALWTTQNLEDAYELLRATRPFKRWCLPHADEVEFRLINHKDIRGDWCFENGRHVIRISQRVCHALPTMIRTIAHEMCHMRQYELGDKRSEHGAVFERLADQVCREHKDFERGMF